MPAKLEDVLPSHFAPDKVREFEDRLKLIDDVGVRQQAIRNLYDERLVEEDEWDQFIRAVLAAPRDAGSLRRTVTAVMRAFQLRGGTANCPPGTVCGRATTREALARTFAAKSGMSLDAARANIDLYKRAPLSFLRSRWRSMPLGQYVMWSTFAEITGARPFDGIDPKTAREIAARLGLFRPYKKRCGPFLLLEYELPRTCVARIPRVTEAYSGDTWVYYFRPASKADRDRGYGRTYVWDTHADHSGGRPEIVHKPLNGNGLVNPIEEV